MNNDAIYLKTQEERFYVVDSYLQPNVEIN